MLVSVIVPNYNHAPYLRERLESIYNQSYEFIEVILLDDASTDGSAETLEEYHDHPKTKILEVSAVNSGSPFRQWQKGLNYAKGEFIWIAESDDHADPQFLEKVVQPLLQDKGIVLSYCQSKIIDEKGIVLGDNDKWTHSLDKLRWREPFVNKGENEIRKYLVHKNTIPNASAVVFRKSAVPVFKDVLYGMTMVGDWWFWCEVLQKGKVHYIPDQLNYFRSTPQSTRMHDSIDKKRRRVLEGILQLKLIRHLVAKDTFDEKMEYYIDKWVRAHGIFDFGYQYFKLSAADKSITTGNLIMRFFSRYWFKLLNKKEVKTID